MCLWRASVLSFSYDRLREELSFLHATFVLVVLDCRNTLFAVSLSSFNLMVSSDTQLGTPFLPLHGLHFQMIISLTDGNATVSNLQNTEFVGQLDLVLLSDGGIAQFVPVEFDSLARLSPRGSKTD